MADGWRNRFMAPVYALVISFVLVVILGAALNDPTRIRFVIGGQGKSSEAAKELAGTHVKVTKDNKLLTEGLLNQSGELTLPNTEEHIRICMRLPTGWFAEDAKATGTSGDSCWERSTRGEDVMITLREG